MTESKKNKSIHRLDLSGSTGPGRQLPPCPPASYLSGKISFGGVDRILISITGKILKISCVRCNFVKFDIHFLGLP